jgi:hypothetical protein
MALLRYLSVFVAYFSIILLIYKIHQNRFQRVLPRTKQSVSGENPSHYPSQLKQDLNFNAI